VSAGESSTTERTVYAVEEFNGRLRSYLRRVQGVWVEGEVSGLRRNDAWATVFLTLKGPSGASLRVQMPRRRYDAAELELADGERVQVQGDLDLWEQRGELVFRASTIERVGAGDLLVQLELLRRRLAEEGLFDERCKRALPRIPRVIGVLTGTEGAARGDLVAAIGARFPAVTLVVGETRVQGERAANGIVAGLTALAADPRVEVIVLTRGGGSIEDLLPFSDERVVRAVATCSVPIVSAVGHEQDTPLCDLAADVRAATPTAAARLVVPDLGEVQAALASSRARMTLGVRGRLGRHRERVDARRGRAAAALHRSLDRNRASLSRTHDRLRAAPPRLIERRRASLDTNGARLQALAPHATLARGYAIVRHGATVLRRADDVATGALVDIQLAAGTLEAKVVEGHPDVRA
jgi:exodeoxyribonuclease VII large subunit